MTIDEELTSLRSEVRYLRDRQDILDCVMNQSRGHDRHDVDLMTSVYFDDAIDEHGPVVKSGHDYGEYANQAHSSIFIDHLHNITTHTCGSATIARWRSSVAGTSTGSNAATASGRSRCGAARSSGR